MRKLLIGSLCLLAACERTSLSPVEIKIDDGIGGFATVNSINNTYTVGVGETLFDIANKFNIDPMNLAKANDIRAPYNVRRGQILKLPVEGEVLDPGGDLYKSVELYGSDRKNDKEIDDQFERVMKIDAANSHQEKSAQSDLKEKKKKTRESFDKQVEALSVPKVVSNAKGEKLPKKEASTPKSSGKMIRPVKGRVISKFGDNLDGIPNDGINIKANAGTEVKSVSDGDVIYVGNNLDESFGNVVVVQHKDGLVSSYAHLKDISVKKGSKVKAGQKVGSVGKTGDVSEPQLHLEIMKNNTPENPEKYLERN